MKKILLSLGAIPAAVAPVAAVISCGGEESKPLFSANGKTFEINISADTSSEDKQKAFEALFEFLNKNKGEEVKVNWVGTEAAIQVPVAGYADVNEAQKAVGRALSAVGNTGPANNQASDPLVFYQNTQRTITVTRGQSRGFGATQLIGVKNFLEANKGNDITVVVDGSSSTRSVPATFDTATASEADVLTILGFSF